MKNILFYFTALIAQATVGFCHEIEIRAIDDAGDPIAGVEVIISFDYSDGTVRRGNTDSSGRYRAKGNISPAAFVRLTKSGFYESIIRRGLGPEDHNLDVIMRRIIEPVPLVVREVRLAIPDTERLIGFDFADGDWIPPFGKGEVADINIQFSKSMNGLDYAGSELERVLEMSKRAAAARGEEWTESEFHRRVGRWDAKLKITFPASGGGILELREGFFDYCGLAVPHQAPEGEYRGSLEIESSTYDSSKISYSQTPLFMQTRVEKLGESIKSANYVKLPGGIGVDARGYVTFLYYYNPRGNDRNLEFSPEQNLAQDQDRKFAP